MDYFAGIECAAETYINVVVEEPRIVADGMRMGDRRGVRDGTVHEVVEVDVVDTLVIIITVTFHMLQLELCYCFGGGFNFV